MDLDKGYAESINRISSEQEILYEISQLSEEQMKALVQTMNRYNKSALAASDVETTWETVHRRLYDATGAIASQLAVQIDRIFTMKDAFSDLTQETQGFIDSAIQLEDALKYEGEDFATRQNKITDTFIEQEAKAAELAAKYPELEKAVRAYRAASEKLRGASQDKLFSDDEKAVEALIEQTEDLIGVTDRLVQGGEATARFDQITTPLEKYRKELELTSLAGTKEGEKIIENQRTVLESLYETRIKRTRQDALEEYLKGYDKQALGVADHMEELADAVVKPWDDIDSITPKVKELTRRLTEMNERTLTPNINEGKIKTAASQFEWLLQITDLYNKRVEARRQQTGFEDEFVHTIKDLGHEYQSFMGTLADNDAWQRSGREVQRFIDRAEQINEKLRALQLHDFLIPITEQAREFRAALDTVAAAADRMALLRNIVDSITDGIARAIVFGDKLADVLRNIAYLIVQSLVKKWTGNLVESIASAIPGIGLGKPAPFPAPTASGVADVPGQQFGGVMKVGGVGGADSQHVGFRATPGETVQVRSGRQQQELELALMRASQGRVGGSGPMNIKHTLSLIHI